jgi:hypothetical protein
MENGSIVEPEEAIFHLSLSIFHFRSGATAFLTMRLPSLKDATKDPCP